MYFLALSQAPPELAIMMARTKPAASEPASRAMTVKGPKRMPTPIGAMRASSEGRIMAFCAPFVEICTHAA